MSDESALGSPLKINEKFLLKPFPYWEKIREILIENGLIKLPIPN